MLSTVDLNMAVVLAVTSMCSAMLALLILSFLRPKPALAWGSTKAADGITVFLFEDTRLVDASAPARDLLRNGSSKLDDWHRLVSVLEPQFPGLQDSMQQLSDLGSIALRSSSDDAVLEAEWLKGITRIEIRSPAELAEKSGGDLHNLNAIADEISTLRNVVNQAPVLIWKEDQDGAVRWANGAYIEIAEMFVAEGEPMCWPLPRIFDWRKDPTGSIDKPLRLCLTLPGGEEPIWFDCVVESTDDHCTFFGLPADRLVQAEEHLREFVQTLTKTFAHLPTGLAVFDRERRLALFNPALTDLSGLEPMFLSARPSLFEFLDKLREQQRMPEPKDYKSWRKQISEMETAAANGTHQEFWSLPSGQTFRITGRPHPDGAVAFLFEDITSEVSLTRQFRSDLELWQSVVDSLDEAVAVFSASGALELSNQAYDQMWNSGTRETIGQLTVVDATREWHSMCEPTPIWGDFRDFVDLNGERADWSALVRRKDGQLISCRFIPLAGRATMAAFSFSNVASQSVGAKVWPAVAG